MFKKFYQIITRLMNRLANRFKINSIKIFFAAYRLQDVADGTRVTWVSFHVSNTFTNHRQAGTAWFFPKVQGSYSSFLGSLSISQSINQIHALLGICSSGGVLRARLSDQQALDGDNSFQVQ